MNPPSDLPQNTPSPGLAGGSERVSAGLAAVTAGRSSQSFWANLRNGFLFYLGRSDPRSLSVIRQREERLREQLNAAVREASSFTWRFMSEWDLLDDAVEFLDSEDLRWVRYRSWAERFTAWMNRADERGWREAEFIRIRDLFQDYAWALRHLEIAEKRNLRRAKRPNFHPSLA